MHTITINQPKKLVIGRDGLEQMITDIAQTEVGSLFILADPHVADLVKPAFGRLKESGIRVEFFLSSGSEPSISDCEKILEVVREFGADCVAGIGGGSVLDLAKLVAALSCTGEPVASFVGNGLITDRKLPLFCVPTTSGAGSEASPNAILIDDANAKKGIIDPVLIPDGVYIDPVLIAGLPAEITAYTGLDALTHCIEAYANKYAHPVVDVYALEGIRLISRNLGRVIANGQDLEAREQVALGAYYGGMCLGPVNTAAVHALAYPLGTRFKIAHGLSNALLLPFVLEFNLNAAAERYADIALAMGGEELSTKEETALQGIQLIRQLIADCGMPSRLSELEITRHFVPEMAEEALQIQRLLKNNVREVRLNDAVSIYTNAF